MQYNRRLIQSLFATSAILLSFSSHQISLPEAIGSPNQSTIRANPQVAQTTSAYQSYRNLPYSSSSSLLKMLDIYVPSKFTAPKPVMIFVHGGGWSIGNKSAVGYKVDAFTAQNYIYISINYRLSPDVIHPAHVSDVAEAIVWVEKNIGNYGGDPQNIYLMGHSAGAHLVALVSTDGSYLQNFGSSLKAVKGAILLDTASYDLTNRGQSSAKAVTQAFGTDRRVLKSASPISNVQAGKGIPPMLLIYVARRSDSKAASEQFAAELTKAGILHQLKPAIGKTHASLNKELGAPNDQPTQDVLQFLQAVSTGRRSVLSKI
jgi:acetyl esterase/lipase